MTTFRSAALVVAAAADAALPLRAAQARDGQDCFASILQFPSTSCARHEPFDIGAAPGCYPGRCRQRGVKLICRFGN
jgi:hypothetical protein